MGNGHKAMTLQMDFHEKFSTADWLLIQKTEFDKEQLRHLNVDPIRWSYRQVSIKLH